MHLDHIDHLSVMIAGIGERAAQVIISEIGVDMSRFPRTRKGNGEIRDILVEAAWSAGRTST